MTVRVTCINKDNGHHDDPHEAITHLGYINVDNSSDRGICTRQTMVKFLEDGGSAYVEDRNGDKAYLIVFPKNGNKYVKTRPDQTIADNLLSLNECPVR